MSIFVLRPGMLSTLQDRGRQGYQKYGVLVSGAMDEEALRLGNILVGNEQSEAALEITMMGPVLKFSENLLIALTGADLQPTVNDTVIPMWRPVLIKAGSVLRFGRPVQGCRTYLCVSGGYNVPSVMGSKSTYLRAGFGGFKGRAVQTGDVLELGEISSLGRRITHSLEDAGVYKTSRWYIQPAYRLNCENGQPIRITKGLQYKYFSETAKHHLVSKDFRITIHADRMGYRLDGCKLELANPLEMISEAAVQGTIQVPADGNPIILMSDRQSVAGYPKIAQVSMADMSRLAQCKPGEKLRFSLITSQQAEGLLLQREQYIKDVAVSVSYRFA
ncbi:biotin-dependent carboxyltransferase family protein [Megasphaera paucivorans]|uniref:Antagonist of KipI n=1 Tax=Megasphaera paucivorans TaxID=349095 RepID=A0A1G9S664_9FIRM|nr:biotin-dependent carboxyltransferase family protein [Megasphaera paucivorans]SDM30904.1 antagonist of KipI [Megasphaera paucivorans]